MSSAVSSHFGRQWAGRCRTDRRGGEGWRPPVPTNDDVNISSSLGGGRVIAENIDCLRDSVMSSLSEYKTDASQQDFPPKLRRMTRTWERAVRRPEVIPPPGTSRAGSSTSDMSVSRFKTKNWTEGDWKISEDNSSPVKPGRSSCSTTIELNRAAPMPMGKWPMWLIKWSMTCARSIKLLVVTSEGNRINTILAANRTAFMLASLSPVTILTLGDRCWPLLSGDMWCQFFTGLDTGECSGLEVNRFSATLSIGESASLVSAWAVRWGDAPPAWLEPVATVFKTRKTVCSSGAESGCGHGSKSRSAGTFMHHSPRHMDNDSSNRFIWSLQFTVNVKVSSVLARS